MKEEKRWGRNGRCSRNILTLIMEFKFKIKLFNTIFEGFVYLFKYFNIYDINIKSGTMCNYFKLKITIVYVIVMYV